MTPPMRITSLVLEKYGPFEDRVLPFRPDAALHVVFGRNEAGKSVTLRALTDLFCGFPARIDAQDMRVVRFKSGDLRLGATLLHADGRKLTFRRRAGRANTLLGALDNEKGDETLFRAFVGLPDRKDFESEFGLTAEALRKGGEALLSAEGRLAETLAAGSGHLSALSKIRSDLQAQAAALFLASGRARKLNEALERYQSAGRELRAAIVTGDALKRARESVEQAQSKRAEYGERLSEIERRSALIQRAQRTREKLRQRADHVARLDGFQGLPDVDDALFAQWLAACERDAELARTIADAEAKARELAGEAASLQSAPELIAAAGEIEQLREMLGAADKSRADLPRREEAARNALQKLERAARSLGLSGAQDLIARMPNEIALTRVRDLLRERTTIDAARASAAKRLEIAVARRRGLEQSGASPIEDPAPLLSSLATFADIPAAAKRLRQQAAELEEQAQKLDREAQRLHPSALLQDLLRMPLPDAATIEKDVRSAAALAEDARQIEREGAAVAQRAAEAEQALRALEREGDVASPEDVSAARARRDAAVDQLEAEPGIDPRERGLRFSGLRRAIAEADGQADSLFAGADRAARRQQISDALAQARAEQAKVEERRAANVAQRHAFDHDWRAQWAGCGLAPLSPDLMRDWRMKAAALIERHENLAGARAAFVAAKAEFSEKSSALAAFAQQVAPTLGERQPASDLYAHLKTALDLRQKAWADGRAHEANLASAAADIAAAEKEIRDLDGRAAQLSQAWSDALVTLSLPASAVVAEAEEALRIWSEAIGDLRQHRDEDHRVQTIRKDIADFEARAADLCGRLCSDIAGEASRRIVETLAQRLDAARAAAAAVERLAAQQARIAREVEWRQRDQAAARDILAAASAALAPGEEELPAALTRLSERRSLRAEIAALTHDIAAAGDGRTPEQLEAEQEDLDPDSIGAELASLEAQKDIVLQDIQAAAVEADQAQKALAELEAGRDAPRHAREKEEAAAEILDIARDWLLRTGAAKLASIAMEQHRQRNQDPVLANVSRLFAQATGGAFMGVVVDYDIGDQPVLKGERNGGERVPVESMSEGTRDQLFLSLRLALLAQRSVDPLPFVGDDLLASFDDDRTAYTLEMMAEFGSIRQAVLFTHHRHVVDAARACLGPRADVIELGA